MWLDRASQEAEKERTNRFRPLSWENRLIFELLQREATELIDLSAPDSRGGQRREERSSEGKAR
jgi:hypothetical protein